MLRHTAYVVEYSPAAKDPEWVAYYLTGNEVEVKGKRYGKFEPDPAMPGGTATLEDYRRSGYDRGHQAPAADFKWNLRAEEESFLLSNVCPQNSVMNRGIWGAFGKPCTPMGGAIQASLHRYRAITRYVLRPNRQRPGVRSEGIFQGNSRLHSRPLPGNCLYHAEYRSSTIRSDPKLRRQSRFRRKDHRHSLFCCLSGLIERRVDTMLILSHWTF